LRLASRAAVLFPLLLRDRAALNLLVHAIHAPLDGVNGRAVIDEVVCPVDLTELAFALFLLSMTMQNRG
jgi:hypothetical protein